MRNLGISVVLGTILLGIEVTAEAAPLDLSDVAADAAWLGHVDFQAMRESTIVQKATEKHRKSGRLEIAKRILGMDLEHDLHGLTFYGKVLGKHEGVVVLHAKLNQDRLRTLAKLLPGREVIEYGDHKLLKVTHKSRHSAKPKTVAAAFYDESLVLASSVEDLKGAIDVLAGKSASLGSDAPLAGNIPAGTTVLMRVEGVSDARLPEKCKLAKQTNSFRFVTGEHDGESFYRARAKMTNDEVVEQLNEVLEGLRALGGLHAGDNEAEKKLVDGLRIKPDGSTLTVLWSAPADDVWKVIETHRKKFEERMKKLREHHQHGRHGHWGARFGKKKDDSPKKKEIPAEEDF